MSPWRASLALLVTLAAITTSPATASIPRTPHLAQGTHAALTTTALTHASSTPVTLTVDGAPVLAYAPPASATSPIVIYLHGRDGRAANGCPWMRSPTGWLVCPEGVEKHENGTASWGADVFAQGARVRHALAAVPAGEDAVAVGFSQGGYVALDLVKTQQGRFRGLVLLAAPAHPSVAALKAAGVRRVVLGAGQRDDAYKPLAADVERLREEGMDARFLDLGDVGHTYATENTSALRDAIAWAAGA